MSPRHSALSMCVMRGLCCREEAAKHRKKLEAEQQFEEGKNEYLKVGSHL